jgi:sugar O-acyltransferase (sialic acid O-acetyltransferase NeuD family)
MPDSPLVVYGCGTQGQSILEWLRLTLPARPLLLVDDNPVLWGSEVAGLRVHQPDTVLSGNRHTVMATIGDNAIRARILLRLREQGHRWEGFLHPDAIVAPSAHVGAGAIVLARAVVNTFASIGQGCLVNTGAIVEHHCRVEHFVHLAPGCVLGGGVAIHDGAFVGLGAAILPNLKLGAWATVGAGSLVRQDVPASAVAVGNPARLLRMQSPTLPDDTGRAQTLVVR